MNMFDVWVISDLVFWDICYGNKNMNWAVYFVSGLRPDV